MQTPWVTFDCFGTLVDWNSGFTRILAPIAGSRTADLLQAYHVYERRLETERPHRTYKEVLTNSLSLAANEVGIALSEPQTSVLVQAWSSLPVFPDVEPALSILRASGYKTAVLTNCDDDLFGQTHRGFQVPFDYVVTAERVYDYKPSLSHFRFFSRIIGVDHTRWVHVACSWFHDIRPAYDFGIRRIWLDRERTGEDASFASRRISTAEDLVESVRQVMTGGTV